MPSPRDARPATSDEAAASSPRPESREAQGSDSPGTAGRGPGAHSATSPAQAQFLGQLDTVAGSEATVLLVGESGSGKSLAAKRLHEQSQRAEGPYVSVHLGALPASLIESELFGHVKGAFTDARRDRLGAFRRAEGGTLVLEDLTLLPQEFQVKLLRALQERVVEPLGGEGPVPINVRFAATTHADLLGEVESGRFREDLYYRLAVVTLEVPPLRARIPEIPGLATRLLKRIADRLGATARPLGAQAMERLTSHAWPGNVRELENALERVTALRAGGGEIEVAEFDFLEESLSGVSEELARRALSHGIGLLEFEQALLARALEESRGNVSAASRAVGLTRRAFEYRLEKSPREGESSQADPEKA